MAKSIDSTQIERQWKILTILSWEDDWLTAQEICDKIAVQFGEAVNKRTLKRDIDDLSLVFTITEEESPKGTLYKVNKVELRNIILNFNELFSLYFIRENLKYNQDDIGKTAYKLINRIIELLPNVYQDFIERLYKGFMVEKDETLDKNVKINIINKLYEAVSSKKSVMIRYYSFSSDKVTDREVDPYIVYYKEGHYYLAGFCKVHNEIRDFRVSRISDVKVLDKTFDISEDFDRNKYNKYAWNILKGEKPRTVKVLFWGNAARIVKEYDDYRADKIIDNGDGSITFVKTVSSYEEIKRWIMGFGEEAKVLAPKELADMIKSQIKKMGRIYSHSGQ